MGWLGEGGSQHIRGHEYSVNSKKNRTASHRSYNTKMDWITEGTLLCTEEDDMAEHCIPAHHQYHTRQQGHALEYVIVEAHPINII